MSSSSNNNNNNNNNNTSTTSAIVVEPALPMVLCAVCGRERTLYAQYACKACATVQCEQCVAQSIVAFFCPQCLAPYASRQAAELDSRCRRCAQCPLCAAPLQTHLVAMATANSGGGGGDAAAQECTYHCPHCRWTAAPRVWPSPVAMATDAQKRTSALAPPWADEFAETLRALQTDAAKAADAARRTAQPAASRVYVRGATAPLKARASSAGARAAAAAPPFSLDERLRRDAEAAVARSAAAHALAATAVAAVPADELVLHAPAELATVAQRNADAAHALLVADLRERRTRLETRCAKRCCKCNTLLVKPDKALDSAAFAERNHSAVYVLPFVSMSADNKQVVFENTSAAAMALAVRCGAESADSVALALGPADDTATCRASITTNETMLYCTVTSYEPPIPFSLKLWRQV
jgi:hypothetical protein